MICPKCSAELLLDYTFCPQCGARLPAMDMQTDDSFGGVKVEEELKYASPEISAFSEAPSAPAAPAVPIPADDIFVTPTPLAQTMPSPYVSTDASVFVAQPAPQETIVTSNVANPYVAPERVREPEKSISKAASTPLPSSEPAEPVIPKEYKALTTAGIFWYFFLVCIPVVGWICLLAFALGGKNKSKKSLSRAILIYWIIFILLLCLAFIVVFISDRSLLIQLFDSQNWINLGDFLFQTFINR